MTGSATSTTASRDAALLDDVHRTEAQIEAVWDEIRLNLARLNELLADRRRDVAGYRNGGTAHA